MILYGCQDIGPAFPSICIQIAGAQGTVSEGLVQGGLIGGEETLFMNPR